METKANYAVVGLVAILAVVAFAGILIFAANKAGKKEVRTYKVYFESVSGLSPGNAVQFNGVRVGTVKDVSLSESNQARVKVLLEVDAKLQMRQDWEVTQQIQGITGQSIINISARSSSSPIIEPKPGEDVPELRVGKSTIEHLADEAPNLIIAANRLIRDFNKLVSDENVKNFNQILASTSQLSTTLAEHSGKLEETIENLNKASASLQKLLDDADQLISGDLRVAGRSARKSLEGMETLISETKPEIKRFSRNGLDEFSYLMNDLRAMVRELRQVTRKLEDNPSSLIMGDKVPEYRAR